jgi:hypothetical protein
MPKGIESEAAKAVPSPLNPGHVHIQERLDALAVKSLKYRLEQLQEEHLHTAVTKPLTPREQSASVSEEKESEKQGDPLREWLHIGK